jgi:hypothetical protein
MLIKKRSLTYWLHEKTAKFSSVKENYYLCTEIFEYERKNCGNKEI